MMVADHVQRPPQLENRERARRGARRERRDDLSLGWPRGSGRAAVDDDAAALELMIESSA